MRASRTGVAIALFAAALATAGCGIGPGPGVGAVTLTVTRDYGAQRLLGPKTEAASESDTAMRLLDRSADISTRYGGGFVQSIDGLSEAVQDGRRYDWFFYVDGVESPVGAADYALHGGESIWWDYRDWSAAEGVPAVVGSWPQPLRDGYEGERHPVALECLGGGSACGEARSRLAAAGVELSGSADGAIRVLVGPWSRLRDDPTAAQLEEGPQASGVFADFESRRSGYRLEGLDEGGKVARSFGPDAGLIAATRRYEAPPVWIVSGAAQQGVSAAAAALDAGDLRDRYAVAVEAGRATPLPIGAGGR
jgi:hypothetical protein